MFRAGSVGLRLCGRAPDNAADTLRRRQMRTRQACFSATEARAEQPMMLLYKYTITSSP
jgi:hypothetical protein